MHYDLLVYYEYILNLQKKHRPAIGKNSEKIAKIIEINNNLWYNNKYMIKGGALW